MNNKKEFLCKNHSGKFFASKVNITQALSYQHKKNAVTACKPQYRYKMNNVDISKFKPQYVEIEVNPIPEPQGV